MLYNMDIPPDYIKGITTFTGKYAEFPAYTLFTIDKESYIVKSVIENSDEGFSHTDKMLHNLQIGRYCSIANGVHFLVGRGKDYKRVTTSSAKILQAPSVRNSYREKGSIIIENDVWIGRKVSIMSGVTVRNGAVIAANSHVVKDVPPYAIVGGNPAKIIGYRFEKDIVDKLQMIQWWYWSDDKISENAEYFNDDIEAFCDKFYPEARAEFEQKYEKSMDSEKDTYLMVVDCGDNYSVLEPVLEEFINNYFADARKELVLFVLTDKAEEKYIEELTRIIDSILSEPNMKATLRVETGSIDDAKVCLATATHLIINRMPCTVELMSFAEKFGDKIEIISGVDSRVFLQC